ALAPLLPRSRELLGQEISRTEVQRFWAKLDHEVRAAADRLDDIFAPFRADAGSKCSAALIGEDADSPELTSPSPISSLTLRNFRSFSEESVDLPQVSILHCANGSGKTTIVEALEL